MCDGGERDSMFSMIPPEVLCDIFKWLGTEERLKCRFVCRQWSVFSTYGMSFLPKLTDASMHDVLRCSQKIETLLVGDLKKPMPVACRRNREIDINLNFKRLKRIFFESNISTANTTKLLENAPFVEILGFMGAFSCFPHGMRFNQLTCIQFQKFMDLPKKEIDCLIVLLNTSFFPHLIRINFVNVDYSDYTLYLAIHRFVVNHRRTLKNFILSAPAKVVLTGTVDPQFRSEYESLDEYQDILKSISLVKLETLWVNATNYEGLSPYNLSSRLVESQDNLECLLLDGIWIWNSIQTGILKISDIINQNSRTLQRLKLPLLVCDGSLLQHCGRLKELGIFISGEQLDAWGLSVWDSALTTVQLLPRTLKILDLHLPVEINKILWISQNIKIEDLIFAGNHEEVWNLGILQRIWQCQSLVKCHCWVKISKSQADRVSQHLQNTQGIRGQVIFETNNRRALVEYGVKR